MAQYGVRSALYCIAHPKSRQGRGREILGYLGPHRDITLGSHAKQIGFAQASCGLRRQGRQSLADSGEGGRRSGAPDERPLCAFFCGENCGESP
jgi:hypothetical protein